MDGKIGMILGLVAGAVLGAGGMYVVSTPATQADTADNTPTTIVVTQVVERAVVVPQEGGAERGPGGDQMISFRPPPDDEGDRPEGTNGFRRGGFPERGTAEWSNRIAQFRADMSNREARFRAEWTNRVIADRTNFIAKAKLDQDQAQRFDVLMTAMNVRLGAILDPLIADFQSGQFRRLSSEERARLAQGVSSALVTTYDEMNRAMPAEWNSPSSSNDFHMSHFVEPQYQPFTRMVTGGGRGGPPGGFGGGGRGGPPGGGGGQTGGGQSTGGGQTGR